MHRPPVHASRIALTTLYLALLAFAILEKFGQVTSDTRISVIESPWEAMRSTFSLWNPQISMGELQNQAYGYLFPMGPFFLVGDLLHVPPWITERLWSVGLLVLGVEGARLLARSLGLAMWPAFFAGVAYGLNARVIGQIATRSAEVLPGIVLPWVLLPIVLALSGRLRPRTAALLSASAYLFMGAVNATATIAPLPLVVVFIVWGVLTGRARWALLGWWASFVALASIWWITALVSLGRYSPPFFDFVEDAKVTTSTTGFFPVLRGVDNWVAYLNVGDHPNWPAGYQLAFDPTLTVFTALVGLIGLVGLVQSRLAWRQPLLISAVVGLVLLTIAHSSPLASPLAGPLQTLLDGPLAMLRNVHKVDPVLRLPLAIGVGLAVAQWSRWTMHTDAVRKAGVGLVAVATLAVAQPVAALELRTPGWEAVPEHWHEVADYLDRQEGDNRAWVVPGVGFGVQEWGWTMDEPMSIVARTPWVTRSQVPLTPPETIRVLSWIEELLDDGGGSPYLGDMLARLGLGYVVVRHDLEPSLSESTSSTLVSLALARSRGIRRTAQFGASELGPAIEVYKVSRDPAEPVSVHDLSDVATVASSAADVLDAVGKGVLAQQQPAIVQGDSGWDRPADVLGDAYRLRERNFGRVHDSEGPVLALGERRQGERVVPNYPAPPGASPVYAEYSGIESVTASSSQSSVEALGAVQPETAPFSAVDGDPSTSWQTPVFRVPSDEWLKVVLESPTTLEEVVISQPVEDPSIGRVLEWRVEAGGTTALARPDPYTGVARAWLKGVEASSFTVTAVEVAAPREQVPIGISEITFGGEPVERTLVLPEDDLDDDVAYLFSARPEVRACTPTLLGPDCQIPRRRWSEESGGIDRTFHVPASGSWTLRGTVVARASAATLPLLDPWGGRAVVRASSTLTSDPLVSARMLYDGDATTSWIADPRDDRPTIVVRYDRPRRIERLSISPPAGPAVPPVRAVVRADGSRRVVELGQFGVLPTIEGRRFEITLLNPTRGTAPIGLGELVVRPGGITRPFAGATATGAVCGLGPVVRAAGRRYDTRVEGVMGAVMAGGRLALVPCNDDGDVRLPSGVTRLRVDSTAQFQPVSLTLRPRERVRTVPDVRELRPLASGPDEQSFELASGGDALISTTRNFNDGWRATLDGAVLPVQRVDGWAQGWRVPAGEGGDLLIEYAPQDRYVVALVVGLVIAGMLLAAGLVALVMLISRGRRTSLSAPSQQIDAVSRRGASLLTGRRTRLPAAVMILLAGWLLGGPPAVAGMLLAWFCVRLGLPVVAPAALFVVAATVAALVVGWHDRVLTPDLANVLAGIGMVALVTSAWPSPFAAATERERGRG